MVLKPPITTIHGIELSNACIRAEAIRLATKSILAFNICTYADKTKPMIDGRPIECDYDLNGDNPIAQAYIHLKTLPGFADAVDC